MTIKKITFDGLTLTVSQWSRKQKIPPHTIRRRIAAQWPIGEALEFEPRAPKRAGGAPKKLITCNGRTQSVKQWSAETGIPEHLIYRRIIARWTPEEALGFAERSAPKQPMRQSMLTEFQPIELVMHEITITKTVAHHSAIGQRVKEIRTQAAKSLQDAAFEIGISLAYLSQLENGKAKWTKRLVERFNEAAKGWVKQ